MAQIVDPNVVAAVEEAVEALQLPSAKQRKRIRLDAGRSLRQMSALMGELGVPVAPETIRSWEAGDVKIRDPHAAAYRQLLEALERSGPMTPLPDPTVEPTLDVPRAGALLGLSRSSAYEAAHQFLESDGAEGLPCLRFNAHSLRVPTVRLLEMLGLNGASSPNGNGAQRE